MKSSLSRLLKSTSERASGKGFSIAVDGLCVQELELQVVVSPDAAAGN